jgi:hypothetical protein
MSDSMIERVARALCKADGKPEDTMLAGEPMWASYIGQACALLTAMREPTISMSEAPLDSWREGVGPADLYKIMIDAALEEGR